MVAELGTELVPVMNTALCAHCTRLVTMLSPTPCPAGYKLQQVLSSKDAWSSYLKAPSEAPATDTQPYPSLEHLLVFVGSSEQEMQAAAATAADLGFSRSMVLKGGLGAYSSAARKQVGRSQPLEMQAAGSLHRGADLLHAICEQAMLQ